MVSVRTTAPVFLTLALLGALGAQAQGRATGTSAAPSASGVGGRVLGQAAPLAAAGVYAYQLVDRTFHKVTTDASGNFLFQDLPAGLYQIIANKPGFTPVVVMLTRTTARTYQFLELQLAEQAKPSRSPLSDDFWALRARIPADILRDIDVAGTAESDDAERLAIRQEAIPVKTNLAADAQLAGFHTEMQAMTGV
ncbi:MAG TPA: carboxypeptidase-like regulatory domain-containing protein, partial [Thermoanaerobaculia bacterium]